MSADKMTKKLITIFFTNFNLAHIKKHISDTNVN